MKSSPLLLALLLQVIGIPMTFSQSQTITLLDDIETPWVNQFGAPNPVPFLNQGASIIRTAVGDQDAYGCSGISMKLAFDVSPLNSFGGQVFPMPDVDLSAHHYLSFRVKSDQPNVFLQIELQNANSGQSAKVAITNYLPQGTNDTWQKVVIPLDAFWNLIDRTEVSALVFVLEQFSSSTNGSPIAGEIILDELLFGSYFPGYVKIDHFDDQFGAAATGANWGIFGDTTRYQAAQNCQEFSLYPCGLEVNYNNLPSGGFGGLFFILGGSTNGWTPVAKDLSAYNRLYLAAAAEMFSTNPGNLKLELKTPTTVPGSAPSKQISGIQASIFSGFDVKFEDFIPSLDSTQIQELTIVLESNAQLQNSGKFFLDDIEFRAPFYTGIDSTSPGAILSLLLNGQIPASVNSFLETDSVLIEATLPVGIEKLESVHLEYQDPCSEKWFTLRTRYASFGNKVLFQLTANDFPIGIVSGVRVRLENYNGRSTLPPVFDVLIQADTYTSDTLFWESFQTMMALREPIGAYRDASVFVGNQFHPVSVATTGMGIISLCIADSMGWISNAEELVLKTLKAMNGLQLPFCPERNIIGLFRHFIDKDSGRQAWNSEFSTIDTGILTAGALFAKSYFPDNDSISILADALYLTVDWERCLEDLNTGSIHLDQDLWGTGGGITLPFNEYMLVAWLAKNDVRYSTDGEILWQNTYADPSSLPTSTLCGIDVLTDFPGNFLSGFVPQFCYYLCHDFTVRPEYLDFLDRARRKDTCWWRTNTSEMCYVWGFGAGAAPDSVGGYHADNCLIHPGQIVSPHIMAGFIPVYPEALNDVLSLYHNESTSQYQLQGGSQPQVPWRYSTIDSTWKARDIQGIDFSTMLFGVASHPDFLGPNFFPTFNDFAFPDSAHPLSPPIEFSTKEICIRPGKTDTLFIWEYLTNLVSPATQVGWKLIGDGGLSVNFDSLRQELIVEVQGISSDPFSHVSFQIQDEWGNVYIDTLTITHACIPFHIDPEDISGTEWNIYPHPITQTSVLSFEIEKPMSYTFRLLDQKGRTVRNKRFMSTIAGDQEVLITRDSLPSGIYYFQIIKEQAWFSGKVFLN